MVTGLGRGASHKVGGKAGHKIKERGWRLDQRKGLVKLANFPMCNESANFPSTCCRNEYSWLSHLLHKLQFAVIRATVYITSTVYLSRTESRGFVLFWM